MSRTYEIICHDCKISLWIGQGHPRQDPNDHTDQYLYTTDDAIANLNAFMFGHMNHVLEFGDDEWFSGLGYKDMEHPEEEPPSWEVLKPLPESVKRWAHWYKGAHGWNPFEPLSCAKCGNDLYLISVYRCYDCDAMFHKECLIAHCREARECPATKSS